MCLFRYLNFSQRFGQDPSTAQLGGQFHPLNQTTSAYPSEPPGETLPNTCLHLFTQKVFYGN